MNAIVQPNESAAAVAQSWPKRRGGDRSGHATAFSRPPSAVLGAGCRRVLSDVVFVGAVYGTEGHRFESCRARFEKPCKPGFSGPVGSTEIELCPHFVPSASQLGPSFRAMRRLEPPTGHVFRRDGADGPPGTRDRLPDGRQVQKRIGRRGPSAGAPRRATTPSAPRKLGCVRCSTRRAGGRCPASCRPARRSPTRRPSSGATSSTTGRSSPRR